MLAPIILFVYNRPWHTQKTVEALKKNELASESDLFVFCDGPKANASEDQKQKIQEVREYVHHVDGFKAIYIEEAAENRGLANSVISGVTKIVNQYGKVIVVEDDIVTHIYFLRYMNDCLETYKNRHDFYMIGGYNINIKFPRGYKEDIYVVHRSCSWGWATWRDRWEKADWSVSDYQQMCSDAESQAKFNRGGNDMFPMLRAQMEGKIDSWAIRWDYAMYKNDALCVWPVKTLCINCGMDGSGVHCGSIPEGYTAPFYDSPRYQFILNPDVSLNYKITNEYAYFNTTGGQHFPTRIEELKSRIRGVYRRVKQKVRRLY